MSTKTKHYATLFDSKYLPQGLALYESLKKHSSEEFVLHVLAMDDYTYHILRDRIEIDNIKPYRLPEAESAMELRPHGSTWQEYCWAWASNFMEYLWRHCLAPCQWGGETVSSLTYLDSDMMFFGDPAPIFAEMEFSSIGIIPHRFPPERQHMEKTSGRFNVSWVTIGDTAVGRECLRRWSSQCRDRCSAETGCGDQCYLDEWLLYGDECHVIQNIGAGLAPWNLQSYDIYRDIENHDRIAIIPKSASSRADCLIFYHYHEFKDLGDGTCRLTNYPLRAEDIEFIYKPYIQAIKRSKELIASVE